MGYETNQERKLYQKCDNCLFIKGCYVQDTQREAEVRGEGNTCLMYQDERDLPPAARTARFAQVADLPPYTIRLRKPK